MLPLTIAAAIIALGCAAACTTRLYLATHAITFHPAVWRARLKSGPREADAVTEAIAGTPSAIWERDLVAAVREPVREVRACHINEQLSELDFRLARWQRVPRVCASVASSGGILLGSLVLRFGLVAAGDASEDLRSDAINGVILQAINVAALGVAGATFAIAAQYRSRKAAKAFQRDADTLVDQLEAKIVSVSGQQ